MKRTAACLMALVLITLFSCRKKDNPMPMSNPKLKISFRNVAGSTPLQLNTSWYLTDAGDSLKVTTLKYYVTNFIFYTDTSQFIQPDSYYLIDEGDNSSKSWTIDNIPPGIYTKMTFMIGVDTRRNTVGAQTGALDPAHGMFWDWKSGYIMAKLEAKTSTASANTLSYHIVGFKGLESVQRIVTLNFPAPIVVSSASTKTIHIKGDILEWFKTPETIKVLDLPVVASTGADAVKVANNYADMFNIDFVE